MVRLRSFETIWRMMTTMACSIAIKPVIRSMVRQIEIRRGLKKCRIFSRACWMLWVLVLFNGIIAPFF